MSFIDEVITKLSSVETLQVKDRCDRCGAQALVRVQMPSELLLDFCGHHYRQHELALMAQGADVIQATKVQGGN